MTAAHCPCARRNFFLSPEDVLALCDGPVRINAAENRAATADLPVVYDNEATEIRNTLVVINNEWAAGLNRKTANLVSLQLFASVGFCLQWGRIQDLLYSNVLTFHMLLRQTQAAKKYRRQVFPVDREQ